MSVREAKFVDIPGITALLEDAFARSIYAEVTEYDPVELKQFVVRSIQRHGHTNIGGSLVLVSEREGNIEGVLIGMLDAVYPCVKGLMATDLFFIMAEKSDRRDAIDMLRRLIAWAEKNPKVIEVHLGVTNAIGDWQRTAKLYEHLGLEPCGGMFRRGFKR